MLTQVPQLKYTAVRQRWGRATARSIGPGTAARPHRSPGASTAYDYDTLSSACVAGTDARL